jgi:hypothetical protein
VGLIHSLPEGPVAIDTSIVIDLVERHERSLPLIRPLFEAADEGKLRLRFRNRCPPSVIASSPKPCGAGFRERPPG